MDPNDTLKKLRALSWKIDNGYCATEGNESETLQEMHDLFYALDQWLSQGGFLPEAWQKHRK